MTKAARSGGDAGADVDTDEDEDGDEDEDEGQVRQVTLGCSAACQ